VKLSKKERKLLKHEIQQGFMHAWLAECRARKDRRSATQKPKWNAFSWFAFWRHPIKPVPPVAAVKAAGASE
jgi:hypothetical protein